MPETDLDKLRNGPVKPFEATEGYKQILQATDEGTRIMMDAMQILAGEHITETCINFKFADRTGTSVCSIKT